MAVRIYKSGKNTAFAGFAWAEQGRTRKYPVQTIEVSRKASGMSGTANRNVYQHNVLVKPNSMVYNATTGTISTKSDLDNFTMNYGENGKPHALTSIEGMPTDFPTAGLNVTYTDFKKIKTLTEGNTHYVLTYGVDDQRRKSEYKINGVTQKTKYYLGDYEEERDNLGNTKKIHYLSGGAILVNTNGVATLYYGYTDYQGNLMALANESGTVVERYAYDPWGKRRNPADWTQDDTRTSWIIDRGYTMHEHLDAFGIINMNACDKREQSQACLSYAERSKGRRSQRTGL